jgi:hypothetical protein
LNEVSDQRVLAAASALERRDLGILFQLQLPCKVR